MYYYSIENGITILSKEEIEKCLLSKQKTKIVNLVKCLNSVENKELFTQYKNIVRKIMQKSFDSGIISRDVAKYIIENSNDILPISSYPFLEKETVDKFVKSGKISKNEADTIIEMLDIYAPYTLEMEKRLLDKLNYKTKPSSVEEAIRYMDKEKKTKFNLSIEEVAVMQVYCKKLLFRAGIKNIGVDIFGYAINTSAAASCGNDCIEIYNNHDVDIKSLIRIINHEVNHAIQDDRMKNFKLDQDPELLDYALDRVLRQILGQQYYSREYNKISFEFDADYKANIQTKLLFSNIDEINEESLSDFNEITKYTPGYRDDKTRSKDKLLLEKYFLKVMNKLAIEDPREYKLAIKSIKELNPIIAYEYKFTSTGVEKRSIEELKKGTKSLNIKKARIYKAVLDHRLDKIKDQSNPIILEEIRNKIELEKVRFRKSLGIFKKEIKDLKQRLQEGIKTEVEISTKRNKK